MQYNKKPGKDFFSLGSFPSAALPTTVTYVRVNSYFFMTGTGTQPEGLSVNSRQEKQ